MPQGEQVKNGKAFEYALAKQYTEKLQLLSDKYDGCISYNGLKYPYRTIIVHDDSHPYYIIVSIKELENKLIDENGIAFNTEAENIDNKIAYYLSSIEDLKRSDDSILQEIYV